MSLNPAANTAFVRSGDWKGLSDSDVVVVIPYEPTYDQCLAWLYCLLISLAITVISFAVVKFVKRILRNRKKVSHGKSLIECRMDWKRGDELPSQI